MLRADTSVTGHVTQRNAARRIVPVDMFAQTVDCTGCYYCYARKWNTSFNLS